MTADQSLLEDLDERLKSAPRFGLNARALILQAAALGADEEAQVTETRQEEDDPKAARQEALSRGAEYLTAVDPRERPQVAYNPRAKFARIIRQTVLNKLAGQHLALAAFHGGALGPAALATDCDLRQGRRRQAFYTALAQESELYSRCGTAQVYQNKAARTCATEWDRPQYPIPAPAPAPAQQAKRSTGKPDMANGRPTAGGSSQRQGSLAPLEPGNGAKPAAATETAATTAAAAAAAAAAKKKKKRKRVAVRLLEADLDWEGAAPDDGRDEAALVTAQRSRVDEASQGERGQAEEQQQQTQQELASLAGQGQEQEVANLAGQQRQEQQRQLQQPDGVAAVAQETQPPIAPHPRGPPPTVLAAPPLASQLASVPGPALLTSSYQPSEAAAAQPASPTTATAAGLECRTADAGAGPPTCVRAMNTSSGDAKSIGGPTSGKGATDSCAPGPDTTAAAAATSRAQHEPSRPPPGAAEAPLAAPAGGAAGGPGAADLVRQNLLGIMLKDESDLALLRGKLTPEVHHTILAKCSAKVLARHPGAASADFLAAEGEGVRKLVARYVKYYTSS
ncbi:hypothetical protein N2152v2_002771 [Parachlorella kessleri]